MSAPIGPGDWVECVSVNCGCEDARPEKVALFLCEGTTYHINRVGQTANGRDAVELVDWPNTPFCPGHFRPIYRPKADLIESLKAPPKRVSEPA